MGHERAAEPFVWIPQRVWGALQVGDLSFRQFGLLAFLAGAADFRDNTYRRTLRGLIEESGWASSEDTLRRDLVALRVGGFINFEVAPRQRRPYAIRVTGALVEKSDNGRDYRSSAANEPPSVRQSDNAVRQPARQSGNGLSPHDEPHFEGVSKDTCGSHSGSPKEEKNLEEKNPTEPTSVKGHSEPQPIGDFIAPVLRNLRDERAA